LGYPQVPSSICEEGREVGRREGGVVGRLGGGYKCEGRGGMQGRVMKRHPGEVCPLNNLKQQNNSYTIRQLNTKTSVYES